MNLPQFVIARADGEPMQGEYSFWVSDDPNDWTPVDAGTDYYNIGEPVDYVMLRVDPEPVNTVTVKPYGWCDEHLQLCHDEHDENGEPIE